MALIVALGLAAAATARARRRTYFRARVHHSVSSTVTEQFDAERDLAVPRHHLRVADVTPARGSSETYQSIK